MPRTKAPVRKSPSSSQNSSQAKLLNRSAIKTVTALHHPNRTQIVQAQRQLRRPIENRHFAIPKASFQRLVREITHQIKPDADFRFQSQAIAALQEVTEAFLVDLFSDTTQLAAHANRITVMPKDLRLACKLRKIEDYLPPI